MKFLILTAAIMVSAISQAKIITVTIPDDLFGPQTTINGNFDGSITVNNPELFFNGKYIKVAGSKGSCQEFGNGAKLCALLNKSCSGSYDDVDYLSEPKTLSNQKFQELVNFEKPYGNFIVSTYYIKTISCK